MQRSFSLLTPLTDCRRKEQQPLFLMHSLSVPSLSSEKNLALRMNIPGSQVPTKYCFLDQLFSFLNCPQYFTYQYPEFPQRRNNLDSILPPPSKNSNCTMPLEQPEPYLFISHLVSGGDWFVSVPRGSAWYEV